MRPWVDHYAPQVLSEIVGQDAGLIKLRKLVGEKGIGLVHGPPGVGKTASVYALANELGFEVMELNASDFRDSESVHTIVGEALQQTSLFHKGKIILVDELDGISGTEDRGGIQELQKLVAKAGHALVLVANDPWNKKFATLRKKSVVIEYKRVRAESIARVLRKVCEAEKIEFLEEDLKSLGRRSGGDVRAAVNDLQVVCAGTHELKKESFDVLGERRQEMSVFTALQVILKGDNMFQSFDVLDEVDVDLNEMVLWLEENIGREYRGKDLEAGYDILSKADVFRGRIRRWQYWRFLYYVRLLIGAGVTGVKEQEYKGFTPYKRYGRILKIWMANQKYKRRKDIAGKLATYAHVSTKDAVRHVVPYVKKMYESSHSLDVNFSKEEIEWLEKK
jgi:replication factor C large subunit